jgi:radial spoke head protein 4/6
LRLWGKIRGTQKDYYIAEGSLEGGAAEGEGEPPADFEPRGTGVNKFVYWATNSPMDAWTQLPDLKPVDIINARSIKHSFSGNLDQKIFTNPFYDNTEKVYLRAQIARIAHSTTLVPKGLFRF